MVVTIYSNRISKDIRQEELNKKQNNTKKKEETLAQAMLGSALA